MNKSINPYNTNNSNNKNNNNIKSNLTYKKIRNQNNKQIKRIY